MCQCQDNVGSIEADSDRDSLCVRSFTEMLFSRSCDSIRSLIRRKSSSKSRKGRNTVVLSMLVVLRTVSAA